MRHATIAKQRISENRRLIITTARHVASGSRYALTRSAHTINKLAKERPRAPLRPGAAYAIAHHQYKSFPRPRAPTSSHQHGISVKRRDAHKHVTNYTHK